ncbi:MAG: hypothetical protein K2I31_04895 [Duncaniella sp.]|nr:hypothetical protein [Duncaniella sp.]
MKLTPLSLAAASAAMLFTSCSDPREQKLSDFSENFARHITAGQLDSIIAIYPAAELAEEIAIDYIPDSVSISKTETEGIYRISYGNGTSILVESPENGPMAIIESRGLFKYPEDKIKFATATGAIKNDISDEKLATTMANVDNMATTLFNDYVASRKNAVKNMGETITKEIEFMMDEGKGYYTLKNITDQPISGDEYSVTWKYTYMGMGHEEVTRKIEPGKDIPANGTVRLNFSYSGHSFPEIQAITMNTPSQESFFKNYKPTGKEYSEYISQYGEDAASAKKISDGPYELAGKLGTKLAIHVNLDKGMKKGTYYYDKYGPSNTLQLVVKAFNPNTGDLTLEETNDKAEVTGTFIGKLSDTSYTGTMTAYTGKTYNFDLKIVK